MGGRWKSHIHPRSSALSRTELSTFRVKSSQVKPISQVSQLGSRDALTHTERAVVTFSMDKSSDYPLASGYRPASRYVVVTLKRVSITFSNLRACRVIHHRLNLQHYLWKQQRGYLIHPAISTTGKSLKIADVGTGTVIWLLDLADSLPLSTQLHGFDINLTQCPPKPWLPANVQMRTLDIYDEVLEDLCEQYGDERLSQRREVESANYF